MLKTRGQQRSNHALKLSKRGALISCLWLRLLRARDPRSSDAFAPPEAELELIDAARYYAQQGTPELGAEFIDEFERAIDLSSAQPHLGAAWRGRRRFPLARFPYSIIYYTTAD